MVKDATQTQGIPPQTIPLPDSGTVIVHEVQELRARTTTLELDGRQEQPTKLEPGQTSSVSSTGESSILRTRATSTRTLRSTFARLQTALDNGDGDKVGNAVSAGAFAAAGPVLIEMMNQQLIRDLLADGLRKKPAEDTFVSIDVRAVAAKRGQTLTDEDVARLEKVLHEEVDRAIGQLRGLIAALGTDGAASKEALSSLLAAAMAGSGSNGEVR